jgi:hypothetical protein
VDERDDAKEGWSLRYSDTTYNDSDCCDVSAAFECSDPGLETPRPKQRLVVKLELDYLDVWNLYIH